MIPAIAAAEIAAQRRHQNQIVERPGMVGAFSQPIKVGGLPKSITVVEEMALASEKRIVVGGQLLINQPS